MWSRLRYALRGLNGAFRSPEIARHVVVALFVVVISVLACLESTQWALILFAIGFVLVSETFNTAIEEVLNVAPGVHHPIVRRAKDLAAAAVLLAALTAAGIGILVFGPPFFSGTLAHCLS
ncbi:MAG: Diacylglycerol kinase [Parcubacteria group bacterium Gr01-1014_38]|nr:MAG: Diacylglycerol kinase [Parcubacteria group bacterium Gr01-1014_38]